MTSGEKAGVRVQAWTTKYAIPQYRDDPVGFVENVLGAAGKPYSKQRDMLKAVAASRRVSVVGANGCGKGWVLARLILWWLETRPMAKVVVLSSTQRQVREVLWQELAAVCDAAGDALSGKLTKGKYFISPERFAIGFATNNPDNIHGFHSPELLLIVDEAHAVRESHFDAAIRLNAAKTLLAGNAFSTSGTFYESHHARRHQYDRLRISAYDTPNLTGEEPAAPGLINADDIADKALQWGDDHPKFIAAVYAQFPDTLEDSLVGRTAVEDAMREDAPSGEGAPTAEDDAREPLYIGVDVGRFGDDKSVLCARRGQRVVDIKSFGRKDTMRVAGETALMARELGAEAIFVDEGGLGAGVVDRLRELNAPVHGIQFGRKAPHPTRFVNLRSRDILGTAPPHQRPPHRAAGRRGARRPTPLPALRRLQLRPGAAGEQAGTPQEEPALARPRRRAGPRIHASAVADDLDRLRIVPAPARRRGRSLAGRHPRRSCGNRNLAS